MHRLTAVILAGVLLAAGCSSDDAAPPADTVDDATVEAAASLCRGRPDVDGRTPSQLTVAGESRSFLVEVPDDYDGTSPTALILNWHGNGSDAAQQAAYSDLAAATDAIVVEPEGTGDPQHFSLIPGAANPDIQFARAIVRVMNRTYCLDLDRVFSTGISNGAGLSSEIACNAAEVFAAVALVAATIGPLDCYADTRIPVLAFHGTADPVVPYDGGRIATSGIQVPSAEEGISRWATQNRCDPEPTIEQIGDDVVHWTFENCEADVEAYWIQGGGHVWPGAVERPILGANTQTIDASELISEWFEDHPRAG